MTPRRSVRTTNVSHGSIFLLASLQLLEPPGADPHSETTLFVSRTILAVSVLVLWLVLPALIERWHRDDHKEVTTSLHHPESGTTEWRSFKGYDPEVVIKFFRETSYHKDVKRDLGTAQEELEQDDKN